MKTQDAIAALSKKAAEATEAHHAMNFAQAALNLAHAEQVKVQTENSRKVRRGKR